MEPVRRSRKGTRSRPLTRYVAHAPEAGVAWLERPHSLTPGAPVAQVPPTLVPVASGHVLLYRLIGHPRRRAGWRPRLRASGIVCILYAPVGA